MTNRTLVILAASVAAVAIGPAAHAQASTPAPAAAQARPGAPAARTAKPVARADIVREINTNYKVLDANGDGAVVDAEIQANQVRAQQSANAQFAKRRQEVFAKLDTNKDGQLSSAEFNAATQPPRINRANPARIVQALDSNKDQKITLAEFGAAPLANFDRVDTNRDGTASVEEMQKARAARRK